MTIKNFLNQDGLLSSFGTYSNTLTFIYSKNILLVYGEKDTILLKKVNTRNLKRGFLKTFEKVNKKILEMRITEEDIFKISEEVRHDKGSSRY